jgi:DNA-binding MarR family transcriptional regulator
MTTAHVRLSDPSLAREELLVQGLFSAARSFRHRLRPELERENLTSPMFWALNRLVVEGPMSVGAIADACIVTSANVSSAAERLETAGLVVRHSSAPDRRVVTLTVTPRGRSLHRAVSRRLARALVDSVEGLPSRDLEATVRVLGRLAGGSADPGAYPEEGSA